MKTALSAKIGKKIKEKRLELKLTIHEVSNEINLTEKFLKAIENGDYSIFRQKLLPEVFCKIYNSSRFGS